MSAKACPHCNRETAKQEERQRDLCDELGCTSVATVVIGKRRRCSEHYARDLEFARTEGPGYRAFKDKLAQAKTGSTS